MIYIDMCRDRCLNEIVEQKADEIDTVRRKHKVNDVNGLKMHAKTL